MATHLKYSLMVNKYQQLFVAYLVIGGSMLLNVGGQRRVENFMEGPNGVLCLLKPDGKEVDIKTYLHIYDNIELDCELCRIGQVLVSNCTSDSSTECRFLMSEEQLTMPYPNFCSSGYPCKTCPGPSQTVKEQCEPWKDTICKCAEDYFLVNGEGGMCQPGCSKGFEPAGQEAGTDGVPVKICQKCGDGLYQPNDNSTDRCRKHSNCTTTPGTDKSDSTCICKGDPETSSNESVPSVEPTTTSIPVPIGPTSATPTGSTNPPTCNQTGANICIPWWGIGLTVICSCVIFIPLSFYCSKKWNLWKKKKEYNLAQRQEQEMDSRGGGKKSSTVVNMSPSNSDAEGEPVNITDLRTREGRQDLRKRRQKRDNKGSRRYFSSPF